MSSTLYDVTLHCTWYRIAFRGAVKSSSVWYEQQGLWVAQVVHTHQTSCRLSRPRGFGALNSSPRSWIFTSVFGLQPSLLLIHFRHGPNRCSHCTEVWQKTFPVCDTPLSRSAGRRFAPSQKSHRHNRSCMWTGTLSGMIFVVVQKLSGTRCGHILRHAVTGNKCTQKAWCTCRVVVLVIKPFKAPDAVAVVVAEPFKSQ